jgi:hypothetical protein
MTPTNTVREAMRSERGAVQTGQTMNYKTLHRKKKIEQHDPHKTLTVLVGVVLLNLLFSV